MAENPFFWTGNTGQTVSANEVARRKSFAELLLARGQSGDPIRHWSDGLSRGVASIAGGLLERKADEDERAARAGLSQDFSKAFGGMFGGTPEPAAAAAGQAPAAMQTPASGPSKGYDTPAARALYEEGINRGLTPVQAAAFVGAGALPESTLNVSARNPGDGRDGSDSIGMFQWNSTRAQALKDYAAKTGRAWNDPKVQAEFAFSELDGPEAKAGGRLRAAKTPEEAAGAVVSFLRPAGYRPGMPQGVPSWGARVANTTGILNVFGNQQAAPVQTVAASSGDGSSEPVAQPAAPVQVAQAGGGMPAVASQPAQSAADAERTRIALRTLDSGFATPAQKAFANMWLQKQAAAGMKTPAQREMEALQLEKARAENAMTPMQRRQMELGIQEKERALGRVDIETVTAPDGTVFEREKGKPGAEWKPSLKLPQKPEERTAYQRELDDENKARAARGEAPLSVLEYRTQTGRASAPSVNIDQKQEGTFAQETGKAIAKRFDALATEGDEAAQNLALVSELRRLGQKIGFGAPATAKSFLGRLGIKTEGISDIEAFNTLINRLTPQQRLPGSGATSDFDAKMFRESLPQLINTPEGNALVLDTIEKVSQNRIARGDIAARAQLPKEDEAYLSQGAALKEIRKLQAEARALSDSVRDFKKPNNQPSVNAVTNPAQPSLPASSGFRIIKVD